MSETQGVANAQRSGRILTHTLNHPLSHTLTHSLTHSLTTQIMPTCEKIAWVIRDGQAALADDGRSCGPGLATLCKRGWVQYRPMGVLGVIAPWNYPFTNFVSVCDVCVSLLVVDRGV